MVTPVPYGNAFILLQVLIPMALGAARSRGAASDFLFLAVAGHHGLLPLLHEPREWPIKVLYKPMIPSSEVCLFFIPSGNVDDIQAARPAAAAARAARVAHQGAVQTDLTIL